MIAALVGEFALVLLYGAIGGLIVYIAMTRRRERDADRRVSAEFAPTKDRWWPATEVASKTGGAHRKPKVVEPPHLTSEPDPRDADWPVNVARGKATVERSVWDELNTMSDWLAGRARSAADDQMTEQIPVVDTGRSVDA